MKHSIRRQFSFIFILVMAGMILLCWALNHFYLEKYYLEEKKKAILQAYNSLLSAVSDDRIEAVDFVTDLYQINGKYNLSIMIMDMNSSVQICVGEDKDFMLQDFYRNIFSKDTDREEIKRYTDEEGLNYYLIQSMPDIRSNQKCIEMWGMMDGTYFFMLRSPLEDMKESAFIANRFLMYTGSVAILLGALIIFFVTRRITNPITRLSEISEKITQLDFEAKYEGHEKNEIAVLGQNMNALSGNLERTISELKTANNALQEDIEKKEKIDEMRREFLSNVTHELKTPLSVIRGYAEGLCENINEDEESRKYYCEVIMDEAGKMDNMVRQLLSLNELENGNTQICMERFDIVKVIQEYLRKTSFICEENEAKVHFEDYYPTFVWGDIQLISEVLDNYFMNALHHVSGEKLVTILLEENEDEVKVVVKNTGERIPEENIPYIWDKFYKVDKARTRKYGGSGVGLSIVKAIMESMHRSYGVRNVEDGVEFYFCLEK